MPRRNHKRKEYKKQRNSHHTELEHLSMALVLNGTATQEGPKIKHWTIHDLTNIQPLTQTQQYMFQSWLNGNNICAHGTAGTGKTFLALYLALNDILSNEYQSRIIIVRSAVPTRDLGAMPGKLEEKLAQYELPYHEILHELIGKYSTYQDMKNAGIIEFVSTSFLRGITWDNAIIIADEVENMRFHEINSIMTRVGQNSRVLFTGDITQTDLDLKHQIKEGMSDAMRILKKMPKFDTVQFTKHDIVRGEFVKSWIEASEMVFATN